MIEQLKLKKWIETQTDELYAEIETIEESDEPDSLVAPMTKVELIELKIEVFNLVFSELLSYSHTPNQKPPTGSNQWGKS